MSAKYRQLNIVKARVYSAENYKGSYGNILGFGCSNVDKVYVNFTSRVSCTSLT